MAVSESNQTDQNTNARSAILAAVAYIAVALVVGVGLFATGHLTPRMVTDSSSYTDFEFSPLSDALRAQRTFGYPIFLQLVDVVGDPSRHAAIGHWLMHVAACGVFAFGLYSIWRSPFGCAFVAATLLFANIIYRYVDNVTPDALAVSVAIATVGIAMRFATKTSTTALVLTAFGVFSICQLRPAYLFMLPLAPLLVVGLQWIQGERLVKSIRSVGMLSAACFAPTVAYCVMRFLLVGYVGLVSFGGNNLAGVMCAFLDEETINSLPAETRELGERVLAGRAEFAETHDDFPVGVITSYAAIEDQFDDSTWRICVPLALELNDDNWPDANQAMMSLGIGVVKANPDRFGMWIFKASRRALQVVAAEFLGNPVYLALLLVLAVVRVRRVIRERASSGSRSESADPVLQSLIYLSVLFLVAKISLVIITSPPLGRFMDAAAVFLCIVPAYLLWRECAIRWANE